jgi:FAD/FMN-containing dehydrogenase
LFLADQVSAHLATVGDNMIENAGGPDPLKRGETDNHVLDVEAVLADGTLRPKRNPGNPDAPRRVSMARVRPF